MFAIHTKLLRTHLILFLCVRELNGFFILWGLNGGVRLAGTLP